VTYFNYLLCLTIPNNKLKFILNKHFPKNLTLYEIILKIEFLDFLLQPWLRERVTLLTLPMLFNVYSKMEDTKFLLVR